MRIPLFAGREFLPSDLRSFSQRRDCQPGICQQISCRAERGWNAHQQEGRRQGHANRRVVADTKILFASQQCRADGIFPVDRKIRLLRTA